MKRSGFIFGMVAAVTMLAPGCARAAYTPYFSLGGGYYDSRVSVSRGVASVSSNGLSLAATGGLRFNQYFSAEVNGGVNQIRIQGADSKSDVTFVSVMPGVRMGVKLLKVFYPYVGASIGPSWTINKYSATGAEDVRSTNTTLAYQGRAGLMFSLGGGAGLDVGVRYQNQGRLKITGKDFVVDGDVTSFNYYITASYGF